MNPDQSHHHEDELKDSPLLRSLRSGNGFEAPDGYFDGLTSSIQDRINKPARGISFNWKPVALTLTLGSIALYLFFAVFNKSDVAPIPPVQVAEIEISSEDLITSEYYTEIDEELITATITEKQSEENNTITPSSGIDEYIIESSSEEELINAL